VIETKAHRSVGSKKASAIRQSNPLCRHNRFIVLCLPFFQERCYFFRILPVSLCILEGYQRLLALDHPVRFNKLECFYDLGLSFYVQPPSAPHIVGGLSHDTYPASEEFLDNSDFWWFSRIARLGDIDMRQAMRMLLGWIQAHTSIPVYEPG